MPISTPEIFSLLPPGFRLAQPLWLLALLALPILAWLRGRRHATLLVVPAAAAWAAPRPPAASRAPAILTHLAVAVLTLALARPQIVDITRPTRAEGYDLMLAVDLSTSMFAEDTERDGRPINRLEALKPVLEAFVRSRPDDRIGLIVFAARAYTLSPLTHDHAWLAAQLARLRIGLVEEDGTAIGDALGLALTRLDRARIDGERRAGSFVVLLSDGANNRGLLTPEQAAALAVEKRIPVHTIGVGRDGVFPFPVFDNRGRRIGTTLNRSVLDDTNLRDIARATGGIYARAEEPDAAARAFAAIDRAQKITFDRRQEVLAEELYAWPLGAALILFSGALATALRRP